MPLAAEPQRRAAQVLIAQNDPDAEYIDSLLADAVDKRPLWAPYWLDRAGAAHLAGNSDAAMQYAGRATKLWPTRPALLWKAAMLYTRMGEAGPALDTLRRFLFASPNAYRQVLAVASRLQPDPGLMLAAVVPDHFEHDLTRDDVVWNILRTARRSDNPALGRAAWRELSAAAQQEPDKAASYTEWMVALDDQDEALTAWRVFRDMDHLPALENGGFEHALAGGLGWRQYDRDQVTLSRDQENFSSAAPSLKVAFSGQDNVHYNHLRQYLPVEPGRRYTLDYAWRGDNITTRSGPYLSVRSKEKGRLAHTQDRWGTWPWENGRLEFTAPENSTFVELRLRRNKTDALDNKIAGTLWLDDFTLTQTPKPSTATNKGKRPAPWPTTIFTLTQPPKPSTATNKGRRPAPWPTTISNTAVPPTSHPGPQTTNHKSPITNHKLPITNHQSPITNHGPRAPSPELRLFWRETG